MSTEKLGTADYPLAEKRPELIGGRRGKALSDVTLEAVRAGSISMEDLRITGKALRQQAEIAMAAGRPTLAGNFERAAELVDVPQDVIMATYELLRPGRAQGPKQLADAARELRNVYGANRMAQFVEEAAVVYEKRGLFTRRY